MSQEKAQLIAPQGHFTVPGLNVAGVVTASSFSGNCTGTASSIAQGTNVVVGVMTASSFAGDVFGNAAGLSTTTAGLKLGIVTATSFAGNFTGIGSGLTGTPNIVAGLVTASQFIGNTPGLAAGISAGKNLAAGIVTATTFHGDGSNLTGAGSTAFIRQTVGSGATIDFNNGNIIKLLHITDSVSFANTTTAADVSIVRSLDMSSEFFTSGAVAFDGSGDSLSIPDNADYNFGSGDFTIECWAKVNSINNYNDAFAAQWVSGQRCFYFGTFQQDFRLFWSTDGSAESNLSSGYDIPTGEWHHYAASRSGDSLRLFVDGEQKGSTQSMSGVTLHNSTTTVVLGNNADVGDGSRHLNGSLSNVRIIKGTGLYTSSFTPPTSELTNITNTKLLCCQSDSSTTAATVIPSGDSITANGDPTASSNSIYPPLSSTLTWPTSITWNGGSAPTLAPANSYSLAGQVFNLTTADGGVTWYGYEEVKNTLLSADYEIWMWGANDNGKFGLNNQTNYSSPIQIPGTNWAPIYRNNSRSTGDWNVYAKTDGTLWAMGSNSYGQLGQGTQGSATYRSSPIQIPGTNWVNASTGYRSTMAIKSDGTMWTWGLALNGVLGVGNNTKYSSPVQVPGTTWSTDQNKFCMGYEFAAAMKTDGTLWMWGEGATGKTGQNNQTAYSSPRQVPGTNWNTIRLGDSVTVATKTDGTLWSWGSSNNGRDGRNMNSGAPGRRSSPCQIGSGTDWNWASSGGGYCVATKTDGTLWSWGYNIMGMLGQNDTTQRSSPVQIPGTNWSRVSAAAQSCHGLKTDGTLWSWGYNTNGQLGQNNTIKYSSPVQIPGTDWISISDDGKSAFASMKLA